MHALFARENIKSLFKVELAEIEIGIKKLIFMVEIQHSSENN